jgi:hypothetical protein
MKRLLNVRKSAEGKPLEISQRLEGKVYIWRPGEAMDVTEQVASWMIRHLNDIHYNEAREKDEGGRAMDVAPWVEVVETDESIESDVAKNIVRSQPLKPAKPDPEIDENLVNEALAAIDENKALKAELAALKAKRSKSAPKVEEPTPAMAEPVVEAAPVEEPKK